MSIDVHEAIKTIRDMQDMINVDEDFASILVAEEKFKASERKRKEESEKAHAKLKALARALEAARVSSTRPASVPSQQDHVTMLNQLDSSKLSLAKNISDAEGAVGSKEAELAKLKDEARDLEAYDPAIEHAKELDGSTLRLQIYQGLGFEPIYDPEKKVAKLLIRSTSGEIYSLDYSSVNSDFEFTQQIWKLASS
ncbi:hypothetical protein FA15DRAFT_686824 [Coprinopsis marcescibilis]|uniref:Kinetochore protein Spc24 n=1 Tax=Coprinopsis marcescibilis TaxID=230819 RepID=A0A5C3KZ01_COPMA|nr:hypothetical protein FA15DRAFT_686824 [Coprinopsis marcescibilis]